MKNSNLLDAQMTTFISVIVAFIPLLCSLQLISGFTILLLATVLASRALSKAGIPFSLFRISMIALQIGLMIFTVYIFQPTNHTSHFFIGCCILVLILAVGWFVERKKVA